MLTRRQLLTTLAIGPLVSRAGLAALGPDRVTRALLPPEAPRIYEDVMFTVPKRRLIEYATETERPAWLTEWIDHPIAPWPAGIRTACVATQRHLRLDRDGTARRVSVYLHQVYYVLPAGGWHRIAFETAAPVLPPAAYDGRVSYLRRWTFTITNPVPAILGGGEHTMRVSFA